MIEMKKLRIYLDTNVIYGYFKRRIEEQKFGKTYIEPEAMKFLKEKSNLIQSFTSFFTMLEVADNLTKDLILTQSEIMNFIRSFRMIYPIKILEQVKIDGESLKWFLHGMELKDTIQLNIAKNLGALFISDDKKLISLAKKFHKNSFTFQELKRIIV